MRKKLHGVTTDYLYFWDEVFGWVKHSEVEKLKESYERFKERSEVDHLLVDKFLSQEKPFSENFNARKRELPEGVDMSHIVILLRRFQHFLIKERERQIWASRK